MLTLIEAKEKWCPLTMASESFEPCKGERCMAWQWEQRANVMCSTSLHDASDSKVKPCATGFPKPEGDGWIMEASGVYFDDEDRCWFADWTREIDHERKGLCAMLRYKS